MSIFLQADSLALANQAVLDGEPVVKTLSIWELLTSGGIGGQAIILVLFILRMSCNSCYCCPILVDYSQYTRHIFHCLWVVMIVAFVVDYSVGC